MTAFSWSSAVTGNWSTATDWTPLGPPGNNTGDTATINATGTPSTPYTVTFDEPVDILNGFTIDSAAATFTFLANETLTVSGSTTFNAGTINITSPGVHFNAGNLTTAAGTTINIGNSDALAGGSTVFSANLSGLIDVVGLGANLGTTNLAVTLNNTGTVEVTSGTGTVNFSNLTGAGTLEANGATLDVASSLDSTSTKNLISDSASSVFESTGSLFSGHTLAISFLGSHGEFEYSNAANQTGITFNLTGLNAGPSATTPTNFVDYAGQSVTITNPGTIFSTTGTIDLSNGDTLALSGISNVPPQGWTAHTVSAGGGTEIFLQAVCYAAGTHILTERGEQTVDTLLPGDMVAIQCGNDIRTRPVTWIGRRRIDLASHPRPHTVAPVRIGRDAFADGVPHRDLVVSPDHAIFVDGKLICARQLVNGTTIRQEHNWTEINYYHVQLEEHAILLAEGLPAESYLDTGNLGFFANSGAPLVLHPDLTDETDYPTREAGSCASFVGDEASVQPVWQHLADRAATLGQPPRLPETTQDSELRIVADGRMLRPVRSSDGQFTFVLPKGTGEVHLVSRSAAPTDAKPWLEDRRLLGVYVKRITLRGRRGMVDVPLDSPSLQQGWWAVERECGTLCRWTTGDAALPLPVSTEPCVLELRVGTQAYPVVEALAA
jgi:hypothetical protein